jgi:hypothetical protein
MRRQRIDILVPRSCKSRNELDWYVCGHADESDVWLAVYTGQRRNPLPQDLLAENLCTSASLTLLKLTAALVVPVWTSCASVQLLDMHSYF